MLIALFTLLFLGGGGDFVMFQEEAMERVETVIPDEERAERILDIMEDSTDSISDELEEIRDAIEAWRDADRDPSAGRQEFERALAQVAVNRTQAQQIAVDALFAMRAEMARDEWIGVFGDGS